MTEFLTDESIFAHREYVRELRLKYSILEKSVNILKNKNIDQISRQNIHSDIKKEALDLLLEISIHDIYFASFARAGYVSSLTVQRRFGSEGALLNEIFGISVSADRGFTCVGKIRGKYSVFHTVYPYRELLKSMPILAVDICEHAYFSDYGFNKRAYLLAALPHLNLALLD